MKCHTCWKLWWCQNCFFCPGARPPDTTFNELIRPNPSGPSDCTKVSVDLQSRHSQNWKSRKARSSSEKMDSLQPSLCNRFATALQPRCNRVSTAISIFQLPSVPRCSVHGKADLLNRIQAIQYPGMLLFQHLSTENGRWMRIVKEICRTFIRLTSTEPDVQPPDRKPWCSGLNSLCS